MKKKGTDLFSAHLARTNGKKRDRFIFRPPRQDQPACMVVRVYDSRFAG